MIEEPIEYWIKEAAPILKKWKSNYSSGANGFPKRKGNTTESTQTNQGH